MKAKSTTIEQDLDLLLSQFENCLYACEQKARWPTLTARKELNAQLQRDLVYVHGLQQKYPRKRNIG